jgi:hypothetical protein
MNLEEVEFGVKIERDRNQNLMSYNFGIRQREKNSAREKEREIITYNDEILLI